MLSVRVLEGAVIWDGMRYMTYGRFFIMNQQMKNRLYCDNISINHYWNLLLFCLLFNILEQFQEININKFCCIHAGVSTSTPYKSILIFRIDNFNKNWFQFFISVDKKAISYYIIDIIIYKKACTPPICLSRGKLRIVRI